MNTAKLVQFTISGIVKKNRGRGQSLGFPTANIEIPLDLPEGIFVGYAIIEKIKYPSLVFIGAAVTFEETDKKAEIYILDKQANLYDQLIEVQVLKKLRDNKKFSSAQKLVEQMKKDEEEARKYFENSL